MLINIAVENFKSFRELAEISLEAGVSSMLRGNLLQASDGRKFVKSSAIYGPNASGKTTILDALVALREFVSFSSQDQKPTSPVPGFRPFALAKIAALKPARISVTIGLGGYRYTYDVSANILRVVSESLTRTQIPENKRKKTLPAVQLFHRNWDLDGAAYEIKLSDEMGPMATLDAAKEQTPPNRLLLGKLASLNSAIASDLLEWFEDDLDFHDMNQDGSAQEAMLHRAAELYKDDVEFASKLSRFLSDADTGVERLVPTEEMGFESIFDEKNVHLKLVERMRPGLRLQHMTQDGSEVVFRQSSESSGTLRFIALLAIILQPSNRPRVVCIDELSASLHPDLVRAVVKIVHSSSTNPHGNQLLFTTHDTHLMNPSELLRRDQILLCQKNSVGESSVVRLDDFQDNARSDANLQKQYLQNRFGGMPQFGPTLEDVPVDDAPLEVTL